MNNKEVKEGFNEEGKPDFKYYAFDWDDNIMYMPTEIMVKSFGDQEVGMSTSDFAEYRSKIGNENFEYNGHTIVGFADNPFRGFRVEGDEQFLKDIMVAPFGPSWEDFVECINGGSIFAIITARGHHPNTLKNGVYRLIMSEKGGIHLENLVYSLRKYYLDEETNYSDQQLVAGYLNMCKFHPVSYGDEAGAGNPEAEKMKALDGFIKHVENLGKKLHKNMSLENDMDSEFEPLIGFSDDDLKNVEHVKDHLKQKGQEDKVNVYYTKNKKEKFV